MKDTRYLEQLREHQNYEKVTRAVFLNESNYYKVTNEKSINMN